MTWIYLLRKKELILTRYPCRLCRNLNFAFCADSSGIKCKNNIRVFKIYQIGEKR